MSSTGLKSRQLENLYSHVNRESVNIINKNYIYEIRFK